MLMTLVIYYCVVMGFPLNAKCAKSGKHDKKGFFVPIRCKLETIKCMFVDAIV